MTLTQVTRAGLDSEALDHTYTLGASGTNHYTFTGEGLTGTVNDPTLYLTRGKTYKFINGNSSGAHPFRIQSVAGAGGTIYNTGVTNNAGGGGTTIIFEVPHDAPDVLYYICTSHASMNGIFYVTGALADGTVTTAKLDSSVSSAIAANTAKDLTALSASNLTSGTLPDARFPATLPTASAANLTSVPAANITGTLPAISGANLTNLAATNLTGTIADARFPATLPALSAANLTNVPAANITGTLPAISGANLTNLPASGKATNLFINGAMNVNQKNITSKAGSSGYYSADRWNYYYNYMSADVTISWEDVASGTTPYTKGFRKSVRLTNGNQGTAQANYIIKFRQKLEAQDIACSGWNYTSASSNITLQFWVKSSVSQNFYFRLQTSDGTAQNYVMETGTLSANTWTLITKTIPGHANLQFDNNEDEGLLFDFAPYSGTDTTGTRPLNAWAAYDGATRLPDNAVNWVETNGATIEFTGFQLEVGDSASDFAHEKYQETLTKCQRYFFMLAAHHQQTHDSCFGRGATLNNSVSVAFNPYYPCTMRVAPSVYTVATASPSFYIYEWNSYYHITSVFYIHATGPHSGQVYASCNNAGGTNKPMRFQTLSNAGEIGFDAEL